MVMMGLNIDCQVLDPFYRYKMPAIAVKISRGTEITNLDKISKAIGRPENVILKMFSNALGALIRKKRLAGVHLAAKLQDILFDYIENFVLCKHCRNPETMLTHNYLFCKACGEKTNLQEGKLLRMIQKEQRRVRFSENINVREIQKEDNRNWVLVDQMRFRRRIKESEHIGDVLAKAMAKMHLKDE